MKKRKAIVLLICMCMLCIFAGILSACGGEIGHTGVRVTFELEGGEFKNSQRAVSYYYRLGEGESSLIQTPDEIASGDNTVNNTVKYNGYHIVQWCRTRTGEAGNYTYSDPWDFDRDKISFDDEDLTLYAQWAPDIFFTYNVCYRDDAGIHVLHSYEVNAGDPFRDGRNYANKRTGYTAVRELNEAGVAEVVYYDENDEKWDPDFRHPGGDESLAINVFVHYLKGDCEYVQTAKEFEDAIEDGSGVVLLKDIDLEGAKISPFMDSNGRFRQSFYGNGHTVSNFIVDSPSMNGNLVRDNDIGGDNVYMAALFGRMDGVTVQDVTFTGMTILIKTTNSLIGSICVAPLAASAKNSVISNVTVTGEVRIESVPSGLAENKLSVVLDAPFYTADQSTKDGMENVSVQLTLNDVRS